MKQAINLLNDLPKWEKAQYPFNFVIGINIVLIILLMAFYALFYFEYSTKKNIVSGMLYQYESTTTQLGNLQSKVLAFGQEERSNAEYQTFLFDIYKKNADNGASKFYNTLDILGSQINSGIWLNQIDFDNFGADISLTGFALQPQNAMAYVSALNTHPAFKNTFMKLGNIKNLSNKNYLFIKIDSQIKNKPDLSKAKKS